MWAGLYGHRFSRLFFGVCVFKELFEGASDTTDRSKYNEETAALVVVRFQPLSDDLGAHTTTLGRFISTLEG